MLPDAQKLYDSDGDKDFPLVNVLAGASFILLLILEVREIY